MAVLQVAVSSDFSEFVTTQMDNVRRARREHAMGIARRGLQGTPPIEQDAISVPDSNTPDILGAGSPQLVTYLVTMLASGNHPPPLLAITTLCRHACFWPPTQPHARVVMRGTAACHLLPGMIRLVGGGRCQHFLQYSWTHHLYCRPCLTFIPLWCCPRG